MVNYPKKEDEEIRIADWLWFTLESWKQGILVILVTAVLVTGAFYLKYRNGAADSAADAAIQNDSRQEELQALRDQYLSINQAYHKNLDDMKNSYLMKLDPYHTSTRVVQYYISLKEQKATKEDNIRVSNALSAIKKTYASVAVSDLVGSYVSDRTGIANEDISELITTDVSNSSSMFENGNLTITIAAGSKEDLDAMEEGVQRAIRKSEEEADLIADHSITEISAVDSTGFSQTVLDLQQNRIDNLNKYIDGFHSILTSTMSDGENLSDEELNYIKGITDSLPSLTAERADAPAAEAFSFGKYSAIGILVGIALILLASFFQYNYGRKLVHPYYVEDSYGIETILLSDSRKTGIEKLRYRRVKLFREEQVIQTFENRICQKNVASAAVLTSAESDAVKHFTESLSEALAQKGVHTVFLENPAEHPEQNFEIIKEKMPVFIVEEIPHGSKLDADQIISFVNDNGLTILGCCAMV